MGWSEDQFWHSCPRTLFNAINGYYEERERLEKDAWRQAQFIAWYTYGPNVAKKDREKVRKGIFFFDESPEPKSKPLSSAEKAKKFAKWDAIHKKEFELKSNGINN